MRKVDFRKIISVIMIVMILIFPISLKIIKASAFGVGASDNGNGTITVTITGRYVGAFRVSANGKSADVAKRTLEENASVVINTGYGNFSVTVEGISVTDEAYNLLEGDAAIGRVSVKVTDPTPPVTPPVTPSNPGNNGGSGTNNGSSNGNTQTPNQPTDPVKKNTDSSLSSLAVSAGKLSPEFASGTTAYTLDLDESVTSLEVTATANDAKASVTGTGKIELKTGENSIKIDCKAEDGTVTTYTIQAIVNETPATKVDFNGNDLGVLQNVKDAPALTKDFSETTVKVNGVDVPGWKNEALNLTLVYLKDADGKNFYIFDEASQKVTSIYKPMALLGLNLIQIDVPADLQKRAGMTFTTVEIDGQKLPGWTFDDKAFENYSLIYMMDEGGNKQYYQYEKTGNRLQLFSGAAATTQKDYEALVEKEQTLMYIIYGLGAGCVAALGLAGFFFFRRKPAGKGPRRVDIEKENYEDRFHLEKENQKESE